MISECQIVFNRSRANTQQPKHPNKKLLQSNNSVFVALPNPNLAHANSRGVVVGTEGNLIGSRKLNGDSGRVVPGLIITPNDTTQSLQNEMNSDYDKSQSRFIGCFRVENKSFIEIRDCFIKSIQDIDPQTLEEHKPDPDAAYNYKAIQEIEDCCFSINAESTPGFIGVVSLQSTTISDFFYGLIGGTECIINCDKSSFVNIRGQAIRLVEPKIAKITSSVV
jgi:hypothetical protein